MGVLSLFGIRETASSYLSSEALGGWIFVVLSVGFAARALRAAVVVDEEHVRVRSLLRTRTLARSTVKEAKSVGYSGLLNWSSSSGVFKMLQLKLVNDCTLDVPAVAGTPSAIDELARTITSALER